MIKQVVKNSVRKFGFEVTRYNPPKPPVKPIPPPRVFNNYKFLADMFKVAYLNAEAGGLDQLSSRFVRYVAEHHKKSEAQLFQDLLVLLIYKEKREGFFVEFGATDGLDLSNTYLLEKTYGWSGILGEPAKVWHEPLRENRNCKIDKHCVWEKTDQTLTFTEAGVLSTLNEFRDCDGHAANRKSGNEYPVTTISLNDLLVHHGAPTQIDYLSIDTEGSEFNILKNFDFSRFDVGIMSVEHNYSGNNRELIFDLVTKNGYTRILEKFSDFDDWYVRNDLLLC